MSIWSECEGTVVMRQGSKFSIRKAWEGIQDELSYSEVVLHEKDTVKTTFRLALSLDGVDAAKCIDQFVQLVTRDRMYSWSQITATIRFT